MTTAIQKRAIKAISRAKAAKAKHNITHFVLNVNGKFKVIPLSGGITTATIHRVAEACDAELIYVT